MPLMAAETMPDLKPPRRKPKGRALL